MPEPAQTPEEFEPELYCLRCQSMEWDEQSRQCVNFGDAVCPLFIRRILASFQLTCMVV